MLKSLFKDWRSSFSSIGHFAYTPIPKHSYKETSESHLEIYSEEEGFVLQHKCYIPKKRRIVLQEFRGESK